MNSMIILNILLLLALIIVCVALAIRQNQDRKYIDFLLENLGDFDSRILQTNSTILDLNQEINDFNESLLNKSKVFESKLIKQKNNQNKFNRSFSNSLREMRKEYSSLYKVDADKVLEAIKKEVSK